MASLTEDRAGPLLTAARGRPGAFNLRHDEAIGQGFNAHAQITARCSQDIRHAFALYFSVEDQRIGRIQYSKGSSKLQNLGGSREIESAMAMFCAYMEGRSVAVVKDVTLSRLADHFNLAVPPALPTPDRPPVTVDEQEALRRLLGDPLFCLFTGGAIPFVLFHWALLNHAIKQAVSQILRVGPNETIHFRSVTDIYRLMDELLKNEIFARCRRTLEMAVRSLHLYSVDESSLRAAYQQNTHRELLEEAARRGFLQQFGSVGRL